MKNIVTVVAVLTAFGGTQSLAVNGGPEHGGPAPVGQSTTAIMPLTATVSNVCTYAAFDGTATTTPAVSPAFVGSTFNQTDVNGKIYTQAVDNLGTYRANGVTNGGTRNLYIHRCTSFTSFAPQFTSGTVTLTSAAASNASHAQKTLNVDWSLDTNGSANDVSGVGDIHYGNVTFTIPAGQWNAAAGQYTGNLSLLISYQ